MCSTPTWLLGVSLVPGSLRYCLATLNGSADNAIVVTRGSLSALLRWHFAVPLAQEPPELLRDVAAGVSLEPVEIECVLRSISVGSVPGARTQICRPGAPVRHKTLWPWASLVHAFAPHAAE